MTPDRLRACLTALNWSQRGLADLIGYDEGSVRGWARGRGEVPATVAEWLETLATHAEQNPPPVRKR